MTQVKRRLEEVTALEVDEEKTSSVKMSKGTLMWVSGSNGPFIGSFDGENNGVRGRMARMNISSAGPTTDDDENRGYSYFSFWIKTSGTTEIYACVDPTSAVASWTVL